MADSKTDAELIAQLRAHLDLYSRVKQPWSYDKLEKAAIAALPRLLELAEQGLKVEKGDSVETEQSTDS